MMRQNELQTPAPEFPDETTETSGPRSKTYKESACDEVTEVSASLEPVASGPSAAQVAEAAGRQAIDYRLLRDPVLCQQWIDEWPGLERQPETPGLPSLRSVQPRPPDPSMHH